MSSTDDFNAAVRAHKKEVADAMRAVVELCNAHTELYTETGQLGSMAQIIAVNTQLADQLSPKPAPAEGA